MPYRLQWFIHIRAQHSCQWSLNHNDILTTHITLRTPDVEIGTVRVGYAKAVLSNALVFAFVRFLAAPYLQRTCSSANTPSKLSTYPHRRRYHHQYTGAIHSSLVASSDPRNEKSENMVIIKCIDTANFALLMCNWWARFAVCDTTHATMTPNSFLNWYYRLYSTELSLLRHSSWQEATATVYNNITKLICIALSVKNAKHATYITLVRGQEEQFEVMFLVFDIVREYCCAYGLFSYRRLIVNYRID